MNAEDTDLERRVLAHEQILQALIAHMVETEPRFLERLGKTFSHPVQVGPVRHNHTTTAIYAARFVREIIRLGEEPATSSLVAQWDDLWPTRGEDNLANENFPVRFEMRPREDLWEVLRDGRLIGGYVSRSGALEAAHAAMQSVFESGRAAELFVAQSEGDS
jgi:hypothetical protein